MGVCDDRFPKVNETKTCENASDRTNSRSSAAAIGKYGDRSRRFHRNRSAGTAIIARRGEIVSAV